MIAVPFPSITESNQNAAVDLTFLRSLPPPPPPSTPPPPLLKMKLKHGLASNVSLDSLETQTTTSSSSSSSSLCDESEDPPRLDDNDNDYVKNQQSTQQQDQQQPLSNKKHLSWGMVQIREYNRTIGDHPEVTYGPPLSLDWQYNQHDNLPLDEYEQIQLQRKKRILRLSSLTRRNLLANEFLISHDELHRAELDVEKQKRLRAQSNRQSSLRAKLEDKMQTWRRKLGRRLVSRDVIFAALSAASGPSFVTSMNMAQNMGMS